ncbi:MAG: tetratricopeptide repeat protein [Elusimicrobia bacterium]|nr:tetratricopeptide repeat protein [Elusimicrobiota bacterium]
MKRLLAALFLLASAAPAGAASAPEPSARKLFLRGALLERRGDFPGALQAYEDAFAQDPGSAYLCRRAAELAIEAGDLDQAQGLAWKLLAISSASAQSHYLMGRVLWAREDLSGAQASFERALKLAPRSGEALLALGGLLAPTAPAQARKLLERYIAENPDEAAEAHYQLAKLEFDAGRLAESVKQLKAGLLLEPDSLPLRYALAQAYELQASTDAALAQYEEILQIEPGNVSVIDHIGELLAGRGDLEGARSRFLAAHRLQSGDHYASRWLAADAEKEGDFGRAADWLKTSSALDEDPHLALRLSYYLSQAGRLPEAVANLETARARWPGDDQVAYFLALGYDDVRAGAKAVPLLRGVLELKPGWREARQQLAVILEKLGRMEESEREFRRLLADKPDDAQSLNYLGYSLADRGLKLGEAERLIREAVRLAPANPAYIDSLGWVLHKQGRSTEAVAELESAAARAPEDATVWEHLGDVRAAASRPDGAWLAWKRAAALADDPAPALRKAAAAQKGWSSEDLGELQLESLAFLHGRAAKLSAVCKVGGEVLGHRVSFDGMLTYRAGKPGSRAGELSLDVLGPLFMPMFRVRLGPEGFVMDEIRAGGVDPLLVRQAVDRLFAVLREYLSGALFDLRPARWVKPWLRRGWVEAGGRRLELDARRVRLAAAATPDGQARVVFSDFARTEGRLIPRGVSLSGRGFSFGIRLDQAKVEFLPEGRP